MKKLYDKIYCQELNTGKNYGGTLSISQKKMSASIFSFDGNLYLKEEEPIFLQTENNEIVSLHDFITIFPGEKVTFGPPQRSCWTQLIQANEVIIGAVKWQADTLIKRLVFHLPSAAGTLNHRKKSARMYKHTLGDEIDQTLFSFNTSTDKVSCHYNPTYSLAALTPREIYRTFELEFSDDIDLQSYMTKVASVTQFFSFLLGRILQPDRLQIYKLTKQEFETATKQKTFLDGFKVFHNYTNLSRNDVHLGAPILTAYDDDELALLCSSLKIWYVRNKKWENANFLMMECLRKTEEITSERLLNACKWLEEIPEINTEKLIKNVDVNQIVEAASIKAKELGYKDLENRIKGAVSSIKKETHSQRFNRLLRDLDDRFGQNILPETAAEDLINAMRFRGKAAHGAFHPKNHDEFMQFSRAIYAIEALCFLLTAAALDFGSQREERIKRSTFLKNYRLIALG